MPLIPVSLPATIPSKTQPTCEIEEYASSRLMFDCVMAARLPSVSDATATPATRYVQFALEGQNAVVNKRRRSAKLAVFDATLRYAVIDVGAPPYTSGPHW